MIIDINQHKISIGSKYDIYVDREKKYFGDQKIFRLFAEIHLSSEETKQQVFMVKKKFFFIYPTYVLTDARGRETKLEMKSYWKTHYQCTYNQKVYDIYPHRGRKCSVFENGKQVAWWDKASVSWFNGDNYQITANDDADQQFLIACCLAYDNYTYKSQDKGLFNYDIGNLIFQNRSFDKTWTPK
ncbi:hypothetical protein HX017_04590 [Myroides marinus]|jgi:uncharacterized protein YxjI|uniref:hypothetical protein n=1 Tax=Myroides marinus TaxID=703342 RepID=UPI0025774839|nr:hypothetical protein [Myroides marinus]MDR0196063.1 hypothetical protein [Myroides sp.]MDM1346695.1 hypothetical protein [Myroides marinus]MDM1355107.1 hypothetical protein [Myroides marinus]MDM1364230.1 hypothetical protein [Myroides marinus]MDM1369358.1 hypothetical protein [Myroides marinus]